MKPFKETKQTVKKISKRKSNKIAQKPKVAPRGGSLTGVHYASLYDACQRKFHMRYNLGIEEKYVDKALIFGSAIHEAKAVWYETKGDVEATIARGLLEIDDRKEEFYSLDDYEFSRGRVIPLMGAWFDTYGLSDLKRYNVIAVEQEIRMAVPMTPGFIHTQRHDAILEDKKTGKIYTFDTKTASSSLDFTLNTTRMSDQVTAYYWGGAQLFGKKYAGFVVDVQYWSSRSKNPNTIRCQRSDLITRTDHELKVFQAQIGAQLNEIQAKERALGLGTPSPFLYRKNTYYCYSFFRKCSLAEVCPMNDKDAVRRLPDHLVINKENRKLDGLTYDNIYFAEGPV